MRCLIVADLHYSLPQYDWVLGVAKHFDLVIIAGDHLDLSSAVDWRAQTVVVKKYVDRIRATTRLITCSGNHDLNSRDQSGEKIARWIRDFRYRDVPADDASVKIGDTLFTICPWWDGPFTRERVGAQIAADAGRSKRHWYWVYHAPPDNSPTSWTGQRHFGDQALVGWIEAYRPDLVFCGHVHQSPFAKGGSWVDRIGKTWVFNAGHSYGAPPAHIVLDTAIGEAVWISQAGVQSVCLANPLERPLPYLKALPDWLTSADPARDPIQV